MNPPVCARVERIGGRARKRAAHLGRHGLAKDYCSRITQCPHDRRVPLKVRNARDRGIFVMSGSDTGNASAFNHGRWHGKEAELLVKEVGMPPMEAIVANTSSNAWLMGLEGGSA